MDSSPRCAPLDLLAAALLGAASFALYAVTLAPTVLVGDGGEFQFVPYLLGVAHPTGYPLYTVLGWLWSHLLPLGDVAYRMNLFSALGAALAVALLYPLTRSLLRQVFPSLSPSIRRLIAIAGALTFAVTPTLWSQAIIAEVYGLHAFFAVLIFYLLLIWGEGQQSRHLLLAALAFGLSMAHHSTTLLLAPAILVYVLLVDRRVFLDWRLLLKCLLLLLVPLLLYLYIPLRAPQTPYLRLPLTGDSELVLYENTLPNLVNFMMGGPFGGSVDFSVDLGERLSMTWGFLRGEVSWVGVILALIGVVGLATGIPKAGFRREDATNNAGRLAVLALTGLAYLVSVAFNLVYTIGDIYVMYIPSYLIVALWMAVALAMGASLLGKSRAASVVLVLPFLALPIGLLVSNYAGLDQSENTAARTGWEALLAEPVPPGAILISNDRNEIMPMWYFQYVDGQRADLLGLYPQITVDYPTLGHVLDLALSTGQPAYLIKEMPGIEIRVDIESEGEMWRVRGPAADAEPTYANQAVLGEAMTLIGHDRSPEKLLPGEPMQVSLIWEALRPVDTVYHSYVHLQDAGGQTVTQSDQQPGGAYYPTTVWQPGERLRDDHLLRIPQDVPQGAYRIVVGMYALSADGTLQALGEPVVIGQISLGAGALVAPGARGQSALPFPAAMVRAP
jgi:4-amino-4-deoxy-L-arabinose transferase-like glycosyltransferase